MKDLLNWFEENQIRQSSWRKNLLTQMQQLSVQKIDCLDCPGHCCTQQRNSMQVTLAEGLALYYDLHQKNLINEELIFKIKDTIKEARLDHEIYVKGKTLRRNYTCPLFQHKSFGCPLSKEHKPFGCLGYNPTRLNESEGESCRSEVELLNLTDQQYSPEIHSFSKEIALRSGLPLEKKTIPQMILMLHDYLSKNTV